MNNRDREIILAALQVAHSEMRPLAEAPLHARLNERLQAAGKLTAGLTEFELALRAAEIEGWFTTTPAKYGSGKRWAINDAGEIARQEMERG